MILFNEEQKFRQWWVWLALFFVIGIGVKSFYHKIVSGSPGFDGLVIITLLQFVVVLLFYFCNLKTTITDSGLTYKFFPFILKEKTILWNEVEVAYVRKYKPIVEYGGWGYRLGLMGSGKALNVSGNMGLQLVFNNGKKILIGTNKSDDLNMVMIELGKKFRDNRFKSIDQL